jgi:hypothetical protein
MMMKMTKIISLVLTLAVVSVLMFASADTASAKGKKGSPISFSTFLLVTGFESITPTGKRGWTTIEGESLQGPIPIDVDGLDALDGLYLSAVQSSHEQFSSPDIFSAVVLKGKSKGTFYLASPTAGVQIVGEYELKLSNSEDCDILGEGTWKAVDGIIDGKGKISVCTNYDDYFETFLTTVSLTGSAVLLD